MNRVFADTHYFIALMNRNDLAHQRARQFSESSSISFSVMEAFGIREALTADHHFERAGFVALLK